MKEYRLQNTGDVTVASSVFNKLVQANRRNDRIFNTEYTGFGYFHITIALTRSANHS